MLFLIANRGASRGYFQGDELDSISWTPQVPLSVFAKDLVNPVYNARNFRPVGHFYFRVMSRAFGLDFSNYLVPLHLLHLLNIWLLWLVLRNLGCSAFASGAGALFFAFEMAVFDVYWKPMYAFDLFCAAFCLLSILFWIKRRWVLSFVAFWLAYKSKELAVMLPAVLACYELWIGRRQWKPLIPFFAASLSFGLQGILRNPNQHTAYAFVFTPAAAARSAEFYADRLFGIPYLGLALLALPAVWRDRRMWLGIAATALLFVPMVFLPGRLFSAYWYVPLIGVAIAVASLASGRYGFVMAAFLALWLPWNYLEMRNYRVAKLKDDADTRAYVTQLQAAAASLEAIPVFLYQGLPPQLPPWGVGGALRCLLHEEPELHALKDPAAQRWLQSPWVATLTWDQGQRLLLIAVHTPATLDTTYITMNDRTPLWQLTGGWYAFENGYRWAAPRATARLYRAARATLFEVVVDVSPQVLAPQGYSEGSVFLSGVPVGTARLTAPGIHVLRWPLPPGPPGNVFAELRWQPTVRAPGGGSHPLGMAVMSFGFVPSGR